MDKTYILTTKQLNYVSFLYSLFNILYMELHIKK